MNNETNAPVTEAHKKLNHEVIFAYDQCLGTGAQLIANSEAAAVAQLRAAIKSLYDQAHESIQFCDSNEFSMDMEISAAISMLVNERTVLRAERDAAVLAAQRLRDVVATMTTQLAHTESQLVIIGELAVVDFDDNTVGKVDAVVKNRTLYKDVVREMFEAAKERDALASDVAALRADKERLRWAIDNPVSFNEAVTLKWTSNKDANEALWRNAIDEARKTTQ